MRRVHAVLGILGFVGAAAAPVGAQEKVTLFGKSYTVVKQSRAETYKNGLRVVLPEEGNRKANLYFEEGADPSQDRLWVVCPIQINEEQRAHQCYVLQGADANGLFTKDSATLTEYFGGAQTMHRGGRPINIIVLNREDTGVKVDRNVLMNTFWDQDVYRLFDLDSMNGQAGDSSAGTPSDAVFSLPQRSDPREGPRPPDDNSPWGGFTAHAHFPTRDGRTVVTFGRAEGDQASEVGVWDTKTDQWYPVLTHLQEVTANATTPFPPEFVVHGAALYSGNEYWVLASSSQPDGDNDSTEQNQLIRLRLTFPQDLARGTRGSIRIEVLGIAELKGTALEGASDGGQFGMAVGREVAPGLRRLYFADWQGNLYTATPEP